LQFEDANQATLDLYGFSKEEFLTLTVEDISAEKERTRIGVQKVKDEDPGSKQVPLRYLRKKNGVIFPGEIYAGTFVSRGRKKIIGVVRDITEHKQAEDALMKQARDLGERIKELNCLYAISSLIEKERISLEEVFQGTVELIPPAWQYPEITCAQLILEHQVFRTKEFKETIWTQSSDIVVYGNRMGSLEVFYLEEKPEMDEGPFSKEERSLVNAIAQRLGRIIERKQAEEALRKSEEEYRLVIENANEAIVVAQDGMHKFYNRKALEITGYSEAEYAAKPFSELIHPDDRDMVLERHLQRLKGEDPPHIYQFRIIDKNRNEIWLEINAIRIDWEGRKATLNFLTDITKRKQTEEALRESEAQKRAILDHQKLAEEHIHILTQQLMKAQESERQRISLDLHDNLAQELSTLKIGLDTLLDNEPGASPEKRQRISELSKTLQRTIMGVRDLAYDLRPPSLDQLGLVRTVFQYCEDFSEKNGVTVDFYSAGMDDLKLGFDTEINLYRLIQEALNNIKKHADAGRVTINLVASSPSIILRIEDDGKGFDMKDQLVTAMTEKRMGLRSMEERVNLLQGKMRIQSRPMQGTRIFIEVPYKEK
jgi:PAS domain S-box-containing protein